VAIDADTQRMMNNWACWRSGVLIGTPISGAYDLEARGLREETSMPLLNGEALDVEAAVRQLPHELHAVVCEYWLRNGSSAQKARKCRCAAKTFYRRLEQAHSRIRIHLDSVRERSRKMAEA
jgi:DNA-directed RNA polymerase specialized sigma24 family protein